MLLVPNMKSLSLPEAVHIKTPTTCEHTFNIDKKTDDCWLVLSDFPRFPIFIA